MIPEPLPSPQVGALAAFGLQHAIASIRRGGPLVPLVIAETSAGRSMERHLAERLEDSVELARDSARASSADRIAVLYDGYLTLDHGRTDAIFAEIHERGSAIAHVFARRYTPRGVLRRNSARGDVVYLGPAAPLR